LFISFNQAIANQEFGFLSIRSIRGCP